jgi:PilZ domain
MDSLPIIAPRPPQSEERRKDRRGGDNASMVALFERIQKKAPERRSFRDRRATPRKEVALEWEEQVGDARLVRLTSDLSTFGLSTKEGPSHPKGTKMRVRLFLPDAPNEPLVLTATVVGDWDGGKGVRLKFEKPPVDAARRIHKYLAAHAPG